MDFLDSLDLDTKDKKSYRVRSWYLYEQYKSLENNQLDAAQRLKDKIYQDRILRQELSERKARRKLCDQFGFCQSESRLMQKKTLNKTGQYSASNDDFLDSYSDYENERSIQEKQSLETAFSRDSSPNKFNINNNRSIQKEEVVSASKTFINYDTVDNSQENVDMSMSRCYVGDYKRLMEQDYTPTNRSIIGDYKTAEDDNDNLSDSQSYVKDFQNFLEEKGNTSCPESVVSMVENSAPNEEFTDYDYSRSMAENSDLNEQFADYLYSRSMDENLAPNEEFSDYDYANTDNSIPNTEFIDYEYTGTNVGNTVLNKQNTDYEYTRNIAENSALDGQFTIYEHSSSVENSAPNEQLAEFESTKQSKISTMAIAHDLNKHLESAQENIKCLANITQLQDASEKSWDDISEYSVDSCKMSNTICIKKQKEYSNIIAIWSRLVSFAYQLVQLNHGNCYSDYSSQFLTAVLVCDVLRRGVNCVCHILQPYVSPIKFASEESDMHHSYKNGKCRKLRKSRKSRKTIKNMSSCRIKYLHKPKRSSNLHRLENCWHYRDAFTKPVKCKKSMYASGSRYSVVSDTISELFSSSDSSLWPHFSRESMSSSCSCNKKAVNSLLQIASYIDSVIKDMKYVSACENCLSRNKLN